MRLAAREPAPLGVEEVDGYVVDNLEVRRGNSELICDAVGPDGEAVSFVVAWGPPLDRHAWPRFWRLARKRATLEHEALLPVRAVGKHAGRPYLAMDRYPETTFDDLLDGSPLPRRRLLTLLAPACEALDLAHGHGLVHQSLSGTSLLVEGDTVLLDGFGLASGPPELTFESMGVHQARYCPPEELRGQPLQPASNVYSVAALLVHALTGIPPYEGTPAAQAYGHLTKPPPRPSEYMPQLDPAFDDVIARGMAKDPSARPASAREFLADAAATLGVELPPTLAPEPVERSARPAAAVRIRRTTRLAVVAAVIAAAAAGVVAGMALDPVDGSRATAPGPNAAASALERLDEQRTLLRARLAASETPQEQSAAAADLADAYDRVAAAAGSSPVAAAARGAGRAYDELAVAADAGSAERFAAAADAVVRAERQLESTANAPR
jgi:hypothetical protein